MCVNKYARRTQMEKKLSAILILLILIPAFGLAQINSSDTIFRSKGHSDTSCHSVGGLTGVDALSWDLNPQREKKFWRAGAEWFLAQAFPATFNRFITRDPYSYISFKNFIDHQRLSAWDWDDNQFTTNQIDHPFHGQFYFNAFRSNGYNFAQSSIATLAGSYIWETAGETQHPSINDLINTSTGGVLLGEMMHRVSRNVLARNRHHHNRIGNEIVATLVNPVNGLNRLLDGKWGKAVEDYYLVDSSVISAEIDVGLRRFDARDGDFINKGKNTFYGRLRFRYSNGDHNYKRPFDRFSVNLELGNGEDRKSVV